MDISSSRLRSARHFDQCGTNEFCVESPAGATVYGATVTNLERSASALSFVASSYIRFSDFHGFGAAHETSEISLSVEVVNDICAPCLVCCRNEGTSIFKHTTPRQVVTGRASDSFFMFHMSMRDTSLLRLRWRSRTPCVCVSSDLVDASLRYLWVHQPGSCSCFYSSTPSSFSGACLTLYLSNPFPSSLTMDLKLVPPRHGSVFTVGHDVKNTPGSCTRTEIRTHARTVRRS